MQKAEKPPPKSPRKKNAVVSSSAKKLLVTDHASNKQKTGPILLKQHLVKEIKYIGKADGKKLYKTKFFLSQFVRKVLFRQLYELIKFNKQYIY